jgi:uncharacterized protein (DUF58 family)
MLWTIAAIIALVWALGNVTAYTLGGFIHVLLFVTVALLVVGTFQALGRSERRRAVKRSRPERIR